MSTSHFTRLVAAAAMAALALMIKPATASAHCDTMDGPVVQSARQALESRNVSHVLRWVRPEDEAEIRHAFEHTLKVRSLNADAAQLADRFFYETVVRIHREGEGAPYTGLKPAGTDMGPAMTAADAAIKSGSADQVERVLIEAVRAGLRERYHAVMDSRDFAVNDVAAGRAHVAAYVPYVHYVEGIYSAARGAAHDEAAAAGSAKHGH